MADQSVPLQLGSKGLNRDIPPFNLTHEFFNSGINMRFKDGSLQTVPATQLLGVGSSPNLPLGVSPPAQTINSLIINQYVPDGGYQVNPMVIGLDVNGKVIAGSSAYNPITTASAYKQVPIPTELQQTGFSNSYSIDSFAFNGLNFVAQKQQLPIYWNANLVTNSPTFQVIPNWLTTALQVSTATINSISGNVVTLSISASVVAINGVNCGLAPNMYVSSGTNAQNLGQTRIVSISGSTITVDNASVLSGSTTLYVAFPYIPRGFAQYEGRLIAYNLYAQVPSGFASQYSPVQLAWSQPIDTIQSIDDVTWFASATNSAGSDYLTNTPGEILSVRTLNQYLIVYKSDSVFIVQDAGPPYYLTPQLLFSEDGILGPNLVCGYGSQTHFVVGAKGIYLHQGSTQKTNISRGRIEEAFYRGPDAIDLNYRGIAFCYNNNVEKEIWICYKSVDYNPTGLGTGGIIGCNKAYCYNYLTDTWYQRTLNNVTDIVDIQASGVYTTVVSQPLVTPNASGGVFVNSPGFLYGLPLVQTTSQGIFESNSYVEFDARDVGASQMVKSINGIYPHSTNICNIQISTSNYYSSINWNNVVVRTFDPINQDTYKLDYRLTGRYLYTLISGTTDSVTGLTANPYFSKMDVMFEPRGRR